jgi:cytoskeleton protein RodZ
MALGGKLREARLRMNLTPSQVAAATRMKVQIVEALEREDFRPIAAPIYGKGFIRLFAELVGLDPRPLIDEYVRLLEEPRRPSLVADEEPPPAPPPPRHDLAAFATDKFSPTEEAVVVKDEEAAPAAPAPAIEPAAAAERPPEKAEELELFAHAEARAARPAPAEPAEEAPDEFRYQPGRQGEAAADVWSRRRQPAAREGGEPGGEAGFPWESLSEFPLRTASIIAGLVLIVVFLASGLSRCAGHRPRREMPSPPPANAAETLRTALPLPDPYVD